MIIGNRSEFKNNLKLLLPNTENSVLDEIVKFCETDSVKRESNNLKKDDVGLILVQMTQYWINEYQSSYLSSTLESCRNNAVVFFNTYNGQNEEPAGSYSVDELSVIWGEKGENGYGLSLKNKSIERFGAELGKAYEKTPDQVINFIASDLNPARFNKLVEAIASGLSGESNKAVRSEILEAVIRKIRSSENRNTPEYLNAFRECFNQTASEPAEGGYSVKALSDLWGKDGTGLTNIEGFVFQLGVAYKNLLETKDKSSRAYKGSCEIFVQLTQEIEAKLRENISKPRENISEEISIEENKSIEKNKSMLVNVKLLQAGIATQNDEIEVALGNIQMLMRDLGDDREKIEKFNSQLTEIGINNVISFDNLLSKLDNVVGDKSENVTIVLGLFDIPAFREKLKNNMDAINTLIDLYGSVILNEGSKEERYILGHVLDVFEKEEDKTTYNEMLDNVSLYIQHQQSKLNKEEFLKFANKIYLSHHFPKADILEKSYNKLGNSKEDLLHKAIIIRGLVFRGAELTPEMLKLAAYDAYIADIITHKNVSPEYREKFIAQLNDFGISGSERDRKYVIDLLIRIAGKTDKISETEAILNILDKYPEVKASDILEYKELEEKLKNKFPERYNTLLAREFVLESAPLFRKDNPVKISEIESDVILDAVRVADEHFRDTFGKLYEQVDKANLEILLKDEKLIPTEYSRLEGEFDKETGEKIGEKLVLAKDVVHRQAVLRAYLAKADEADVERFCDNLKDYHLTPEDVLNDQAFYTNKYKQANQFPQEKFDSLNLNKNLFDKLKALGEPEVVLHAAELISKITVEAPKELNSGNVSDFIDRHEDYDINARNDLINMTVESGQLAEIVKESPQESYRIFELMPQDAKLRVTAAEVLLMSQNFAFQYTDDAEKIKKLIDIVGVDKCFEIYKSKALGFLGELLIKHALDKLTLLQKIDLSHFLTALQAYALIKEIDENTENLPKEELKTQVSEKIVQENKLNDLAFSQAYEVFSYIKNADLKIKTAELILRDDRFVKASRPDQLDEFVKSVGADKVIEICGLHQGQSKINLIISLIRSQEIDNVIVSDVKFGDVVVIKGGVLKELNQLEQAMYWPTLFEKLNVTGEELIDILKKLENDTRIFNAIIANSDLSEKVAKVFGNIAIEQNTVEHKLLIALLKSKEGIYNKKPSLINNIINKLSEKDITDVLASSGDGVKEKIVISVVKYQPEQENISLKFRIDLLKEHHQDIKLDELAVIVNSYKNLFINGNAQEKQLVFSLFEDIFSSPDLNLDFYNKVDKDLLLAFVDHCMAAKVDGKTPAWAIEALDKIVIYAYQDVAKHELVSAIQARIDANLRERYTNYLIKNLGMTEDKIKNTHIAIIIAQLIQNPESVAAMGAEKYRELLDTYQRISKLLKYDQYHSAINMLKAEKDKDEPNEDKIKRQERKIESLRNFETAWPLKEMIVNLRKELRTMPLDSKTKQEAERILNTYSFVEMNKKLESKFLDALRNWFVGDAGDIAVEESFLKSLVVEIWPKDNIVSADLKIAIGIAGEGDQVFGQDGKPLGFIKNGIVYTLDELQEYKDVRKEAEHERLTNELEGAADDFEKEQITSKYKIILGEIDRLTSIPLTQSGVSVGTALFDMEGNSLGTLLPDNKIKDELMFDEKMAQALLMNKSAFDKIGKSKQEQLLKRIIELGGVPEFLKEAYKSGNEHIRGFFIDYLKNNYPVLTQKDWESVVAWVPHDELINIFDQYIPSKLDVLGLVSSESEKTQRKDSAEKLLFALLRHPEKINQQLSSDEGKTKLLDMFNKCIVDDAKFDVAEKRLKSPDIKQSAKNILRVALLSNEQYVKELRGEAIRKIADDEVIKLRVLKSNEPKRERYADFNKAVSVLSLDGLTPDMIKNLRQEVRIRLIESGNFNKDNFDYLVHDLDKNQNYIGAYIKTMDTMEAIKFVLEEFNRSLPASQQYKKDLIHALFGRPDCVNLLRNMMKSNTTHGKVTAGLSEDTKLINIGLNNLMKVLGEIGKPEEKSLGLKGNLLGDCFKTLGKLPENPTKVSKERKEAVRNLSELLEIPVYKKHLTATQKSVHREAAAEAGGPGSWWRTIKRWFGFGNTYVAETAESDAERGLRLQKESREKPQKPPVQSEKTTQKTEKLTADIQTGLLKDIEVSGAKVDQDITKAIEHVNSFNTAANATIELAHTREYLERIKRTMTLRDEYIAKSKNEYKSPDGSIPFYSTQECLIYARKAIELQNSINEITRHQSWADIVRGGALSEDNYLKTRIPMEIKDKKFDLDFDMLSLKNLIIVADMLGRGIDIEITKNLNDFLGKEQAQALLKGYNGNIKDLRERVAESMLKRLNLYSREGYSDLFFDFLENAFPDIQKGEKGGRPSSPMTEDQGDLLREGYVPKEPLVNPVIRDNSEEHIFKEGETPKGYIHNYIQQYGNENQKDRDNSLQQHKASADSEKKSEYVPRF